MLRSVTAFLLALVTGWFGFAGAFSNRTPDETLLARVVVVLSIELAGGIGVGLLVPAYWYVSIFAAWGSLLFVPQMLSAVVANPALMVHSPDSNIPVWEPLVAPLLALACGYAGRQLGIAANGGVRELGGMQPSRLAATSRGAVTWVLASVLLSVSPLLGAVNAFYLIVPGVMFVYAIWLLFRGGR